MATKLNSFLFEGKKIKSWKSKGEYVASKLISDSIKEPVSGKFKLEGSTDKIRNMRTSLHLFPSFARKEMDEHGVAFLSNCSYKASKCGCRIIGNGTLQNPLEIKFCNKHKS